MPDLKDYQLLVVSDLLSSGFTETFDLLEFS